MIMTFLFNCKYSIFQICSVDTTNQKLKIKLEVFQQIWYLKMGNVPMLDHLLQIFNEEVCLVTDIVVDLLIDGRSY